MTTIIGFKIRFVFIVLFMFTRQWNGAWSEFKNTFKELDWWQKAVVYQVYPRSFKDSNGDGLGDLKGIEEMADYFAEVGFGAVWLNPIYKSPMADFGYDIANYTEIYDKFGTIEDLKSLKRKLDKHTLPRVCGHNFETSCVQEPCKNLSSRCCEILKKSIAPLNGIKLILDFVPNHTSDESEWFTKSVKRIKPYTDYYVWKDPKGWKDGKPIPPNNWISVFNINPAWTYNEERKQFYLHQFLDKQPDINYRCPELRKEMEQVIKFWLEAGVDGFRIDVANLLVEHEGFPDEVYIDPNEPHNEYHNLIHNYTTDQPMTFDINRSWRKILDQYKKDNDVDSRIILTEAYTDLDTTMKFYGTLSEPVSNIPFNFQLIIKISPQSNAKELANIIKDWLDHMPEGMWPNWVIGNHDQFRVSHRYGVEMVDALNMLVTLLPGTAITYYGEELGMEYTFVRWDQTKDPQGVILGKEKYLTVTRDAGRSPMQWDDSLSSGFSTSSTTWLPVNPNFWRINVETQRKEPKSHFNVYKKLVQARKLPTIQHGDVTIVTQGDWTLIFTRSLPDNPTFIVVINMATEPTEPDLSALGIPLPSQLFVYEASVNSIYKYGDTLGTGPQSFYLRPKAALILTTELIAIPATNAPSSANSETEE